MSRLVQGFPLFGVHAHDVYSLRPQRSRFVLRRLPSAPLLERDVLSPGALILTNGPPEHIERNDTTVCVCFDHRGRRAGRSSAAIATPPSGSRCSTTCSSPRAPSTDSRAPPTTSSSTASPTGPGSSPGSSPRSTPRTRHPRPLPTRPDPPTLATTLTFAALRPGHLANRAGRGSAALGRGEKSIDAVIDTRHPPNQSFD